MRLVSQRPSARAWWLIFGIAVLLAVGVVLPSADLHTPRWRAEARALLEPAVLPEDEDGSAGRYALDLLERERIVPTFASVVGTPRFAQEAADRLGLPEEVRASVQVQASGSARSSLVVVTAVADDPEMATAMAHETLLAGRRYVNDRDDLFALDEPSTTPASRHRPVLRWVPALGILLAVVLLLARVVPAGARAAVSRR